MNLFIRVFRVWITSFFKKKLTFSDESVLNFYVMPSDLDVYGHMNNGRYLSIMDLGRMDLILRTGLGIKAKNSQWFPLIASTIIRYKKSLRPFQPFALHTRILSWDEKWFYIEQTIRNKGHVFTHAWLKGVFRSRTGNVSTKEILEAVGVQAAAPSDRGVAQLFEQVRERT